MNLKELFEKRANLIAEMRQYQETHKDKWGEEQEARWAAMDADVDKLTAEIRRLEKLEAVEAENRQSAGREVPPADPNPQGGEQRTATDSEEYRAAFANFLRTGNDSEFRSMNITVDPEGGYFVPDQMLRTIWSQLNEYLPLRQYATVMPTSSDIKIPISNDDGSAYWVAEEGARQESNDTFGQASLSGHFEAALAKVTRALAQDSVFPIESFLSRSFALRFAKLEEPAFTTGNGVGQPTGFTVNAQVGVTTAVNNAIDPDEIMDMFHALKAPYRPKAIWQMADTTIAAVRKMKDGEGQYIWRPGLEPGKPDLLLGKPVVSNGSMAAIAGSAKVAAFGDFSYYMIADRGTPYVQRITELYTATGQIGFLMEKRTDGNLIVPEAIKLLVMHA